MALSRPEEPPPLIFQGESGTRQHWQLGLMIFLSLLGHAASFYVFQVAYTPNGSLTPPPARVVMVPLDQPENAPLARWLALTDPTLPMQSDVLEDAAVLDTLGFHYVPSYNAGPPAFKALDPITTTESITPAPRSMEPGPVAMNDAVVAGAAGPATEHHGAPAPVESRVVLGGTIAALAPRPLPSVRFTGSAGTKPLEPTVYLVGVRPEGGTPFLFPVRQTPASDTGAGADEADEFARDYLARLDFRPPAAANGFPVWDVATFYWGNESQQTAK